MTVDFVGLINLDQPPCLIQRSPTSSEFCGWIASGYAALVARKTSSRSRQLHRTCDG
jgi:hypothetical protein